MLAKANRVTRPADFRTAVRWGRRIGTSAVVLYLRERTDSDVSRFGFVVAKSVGGAVTRNLIRRRLRAVSREVLPTMRGGVDVVMRALPGAEHVAWATLHVEIAQGLEKGLGRV